MPRLRIAAGQLNSRVGALEHNAAAIGDLLDRATEARCDLLVLPEFSLIGNPADDLLAKTGFITDGRTAVEQLARRAGDCAVLVGFADRGDDGAVHSAIAVCAHGQIVDIVHRRTLVDGGVHDDSRTLTAGTEPARLHQVRGVPIGIVVGADVLADDTVDELVRGGAELIVAATAFPYAEGESSRREARFSEAARRHGVSLVLADQVGGQDDLLFEGAGLAIGADGGILARNPQFESGLLIVDLDRLEPDHADRRREPIAFPTRIVGLTESSTTTDEELLPEPTLAPRLHPDEEIYRAIVMGTRDYLDKSGFSDVVIGLSGGMDSTIAAVIAVDALGPDRVRGILLPSRYSSDHSRTDALALADNLGIETRTVPIEAGHEAIAGLLEPALGRPPTGVADENIQSRLRGVVLMALANEHGWIVLATSNKSEVAVGYTTLYGDNIGGYAVLKDLYKSRIYTLAEWRNTVGDSPVIPENIITKPPSAELRPDQVDQDSLPPYDVLDPILFGYLEEHRTATELMEAGHDRAAVERVTRLVDGAEFKRRQSPIGPRVSARSFGRDRQFPVVNGYR